MNGVLPHSHYHAYSSKKGYTARWIMAHLWVWWKREHKDQVLEWYCEGYDASLRGWIIISEVVTG